MNNQGAWNEELKEAFDGIGRWPGPGELQDMATGGDSGCDAAECLQGFCVAVMCSNSACQTMERDGRQQYEHADAHGGKKRLSKDQSIRHGLLAHPFAVDDDDGFVTDWADGIFIEAEVAAFQF